MPNGKNDIIRLKSQKLLHSKAELDALPGGKLLINTINAFSYNNAQKDEAFAMALVNGDVLIPDGMSVVKACQWLGNPDAPKERVAGWDLFMHEMKKLNALKPLETSIHHERKRVLFFGSSERVLELIRERTKKDFPNLEVVTYSPPYKDEFSEEESKAMVDFINDADPDLMWVGMTAPKQEKWTYQHWQEMNIRCHVGTVGAVFDFYAGTLKRAPLWWQQHGIEWLYRLMKEPRRMWKRYIIGNVEFLWYVIGEKLKG
ncbi:MAG: WecB/TagA/CpsF family glycosyltransferase [Prevotella sp.]|nr:WecB/TagA/CpsF family glycosyltransferase [Prevotella sp.]